MRKVLIPVIAFSLVLVGGAFLSAQASCFGFLNPCNWSLSSCCAPAVEAPAAAEVPAPEPAAVQPTHGCCPDLSWLSPCNWHWPSCLTSQCANAAEVPAAAETPAPEPPAPHSTCGCCLDFSWLNPCNWHFSSCCPAPQ